MSGGYEDIVIKHWQCLIHNNGRNFTKYQEAKSTLCDAVYRT